MSMHKIFFGTIVFFSLAFLAACGGGGSGSSGAAGGAGAAGADGATGATGSIAVPTDADLAITANAAIDTNIALGTVVRGFNVTGADALAVDSRQRYYVYEGTSATAKQNLWNNSSGLTFTGGNAIYQSTSANSAGSFDTRGITAGDNITITSNAVALNVATGATTHMIVCAGNEAGDAASCPSAALEDRGSATAALGMAGDNITIVNFVTGLTVIRASGGDNVDVDTLTIPSSKYTAIVDSGTLKAGTIGTAGQTKGVINLGVTDTYIIGLGDNATSLRALDHTSAGMTAINSTVDYPATITDITVSEGFGSATYVVMQNAGDNMSVHAISSGALVVFNDNASAANTAVAVGGPSNGPGDGHCSAANPNGAEVVSAYFYDNATTGLLISKWTAAAVTDIVIANNNADNTTFTTSCAATWVAASGYPGGKLYIAMGDNTTGYALNTSYDNGSSFTTVLGPHGESGAGSHMAITTDPETLNAIVAFNKAGKVFVDRYDNVTSTWEMLIDGSTAIAAAADTVSITTSGNDNIILATQNVTGDNSTVVVFYDN